MIVQCEHCHTKYRIADEKVKGKGVKVRCAKCENVFTVVPPENDLQVPSDVQPAESAEGPPPPSRQEPPAPPQQEDLTQDSPGLPPLPPLDGTISSQEQPEQAGPEGAEPTEQVPGGFESPPPEETHEEPAAQRPVHELDQTGLASPPPSTSDYPDDGGFEIEGTLRESSQPGSDLPGSDAGEEIPATQDPDTGWGNIAIGGQDAPDAAEGSFDLAGSPGYTPPPPVPMDEPDQEAFPAPAVEPPPAAPPAPAYQPDTRTSSGGKKGLVILLLIALLGAGGYFVYPKIMEVIQSRGQQTEGTLTPTDIQVKALTRTDGKIIYLVRGNVANESAGNVGMIQVEAQFRNASGDVLAKATSYCGNLFEDGDLVRMDISRIRSDLQNELGQSLSNASIAAGQSVPFLVVLDNPPSGVSKVTVTILSFKETT